MKYIYILQNYSIYLMQPHSLKLSPESDLINSIKEYSLSNNLYGYVSGVVGNLRTVCIQCPGKLLVEAAGGKVDLIESKITKGKLSICSWNGRLPLDNTI